MLFEMFQERKKLHLARITKKKLKTKIKEH